MLRLRHSITLLILLTFLAAACVPVTPTASPAEPTTASPQTNPTLPPSTVPVPTQVPTQPPATLAPTQVPPTAQPTDASGATISLSPSSAAPGDTVTIQGNLPGGPNQAGAAGNEALQHANICWQGCQQGLLLQGLSVAWSASQAGQFTIQMTVPTVPYLASDGPHALDAGDYQVGVQCLGPDIQGCELKPAMASASLHLSIAAKSACPNPGCTTFTLNPAQGKAGDTIRASGWAPLDNIIDAMAFGYSLVLVPAGNEAPVNIASLDQSLDGQWTASFVVPQSAPGLGELKPGSYTLALQAARPQGQDPILLAKTPFQIGGGLTWGALKLGEPAWIEHSFSLTLPALDVSPAPTGLLSYCLPGAISLSSDVGKTWSSVPTNGVASAAEAIGYPLQQDAGAKPTCTTVVGDSAHLGSLFAVFRTMRKDAGAPPVYYMGFFTRDGGKTWKAAPAPAGSTLELFGGFWPAPGKIEALFNSSSSHADQPAPPIVEQTSDGGQTWSAASPLCPPNAPCVRWGPAASSISGMGSGAPQGVMVSSDQGKTWTFPGPAVELRNLGANQLAAFPSSSALLVSGGNDFPVMLSQDGGKTWQAVTLPTLPDNQGGGQPFPQLQVLPDGSLLALPDGKAWQRLAAGAPNWCPLAGISLPNQPLVVTSGGDQLFWLPTDNNGNVGPLGSAPLSAVKCGAG